MRSDPGTGEGPVDPAPPSAPTVTTQGLPAGRVVVSWAAVTGATSYEVWRSRSPSEAFVQLSTLTASPYYDDDLAGGGEVYRYKVRAVNRVGGTDSAEATWQVVPAAPVLSASVQGNRVTLSWTKPPGGLDYVLNRESNANNAFFSVMVFRDLVGSASSYVDAVARNTTAASAVYSYRLQIRGVGPRSPQPATAGPVTVVWQ